MDSGQFSVTRLPQPDWHLLRHRLIEGITGTLRGFERTNPGETLRAIVIYSDGYPYPGFSICYDTTTEHPRRTPRASSIHRQEVEEYSFCGYWQAAPPAQIDGGWDIDELSKALGAALSRIARRDQEAAALLESEYWAHVGDRLLNTVEDVWRELMAADALKAMDDSALLGFQDRDGHFLPMFRRVPEWRTPATYPLVRALRGGAKRRGSVLGANENGRITTNVGRIADPWAELENPGSRWRTLFDPRLLQLRDRVAQIPNGHLHYAEVLDYCATDPWRRGREPTPSQLIAKRHHQMQTEAAALYRTLSGKEEDDTLTLLALTVDQRLVACGWDGDHPEGRLVVTWMP